MSTENTTKNVSHGLEVGVPQSTFDAVQHRAVGAERKVSHLNSLLGEAEAENERLSQLAEVLKEEIRSYQRSEERKKHIENLEYVKNVILQVILP